MSEEREAVFTWFCLPLLSNHHLCGFQDGAYCSLVGLPAEHGALTNNAQALPTLLSCGTLESGTWNVSHGGSLLF